MKEKISISAIITARGGSKGLPRKNILPFLGKPLIAHSILAALNCPAIKGCFVTTDDAQIKKISLEWGAQVIDRPAELATDRASSVDAVRHALKALERDGRLPDYFALLQPTSPLRGALHLTTCIKDFLKSGMNCAISVNESRHHPYKSLRAEGARLLPLIDEESLEAPRQSLPKVYCLNGAIYVMASKLFLQKNAFFVPPVMPFIMSEEDSVEIDTEFDLRLAELVVSLKIKKGTQR